jgi:NodT family efflux transporter outer membrane factor (OMF) lipoprotein
VDLHSWWRAFKDPEIECLVDQALAHNLKLAQAQKRLLKARYLVGYSRTAFSPQLHARTMSSQPADTRDSYFQYGFDATWELGLFGRREGKMRIAKAHVQEAEAVLSAARVSLVAEVVRNYIELTTAQCQMLLTSQLVHLDQQRLELLQHRVRLGLASVDAVSKSQAILAQTQAEVPTQQKDVELAAQRLALLLGRTKPKPLWLRFRPMPRVGSFRIAPIPADLVRTRPDIRAAEAKVLAAAGELGVARADLYPYLALGGAYMTSINISHNRTNDGVFNTTPSIGPIIDIPLFDWGHRKAMASAQGEELDAAVLDYRQTVLQAVAEVEEALSSLRCECLRVQKSEAALTALNKSRQAQQHLLHLGLSSQLRLFAVDRLQIRAQLDLVQAWASRDLAFIVLYKALGGASLPAPARK